jgi:hypothetical protein
MYAPCQKSYTVVRFEIVEKSDDFCGREHTLLIACKLLVDGYTIIFFV